MTRKITRSAGSKLPPETLLKRQSLNTYSHKGVRPNIVRLASFGLEYGVNL